MGSVAINMVQEGAHVIDFKDNLGGVGGDGVAMPVETPQFHHRHRGDTYETLPENQLLQPEKNKGVGSYTTIPHGVPRRDTTGGIS
jgi:hypothetical protein